MHTYIYNTWIDVSVFEFGASVLNCVNANSQLLSLYKWPPAPAGPLFSLFVQVRWCLLVLSFSFVFVFVFLLVQPFYKRPCVCGSASWNVHVSWWCFSRRARPRLPPPRCECASASWITFENKTTDSHISGIHVLLCFVSFFFSLPSAPLRFSWSRFTLSRILYLCLFLCVIHITCFIREVISW